MAAIYPTVSGPSRQKPSQPRAELALLPEARHRGDVARLVLLVPARRMTNWVRFAELALRIGFVCTSGRRRRLASFCAFAHVSRPASGRRNWLCSVDALIRAIHHNSFLTKCLSRLSLRGNWLCFAQLTGRPERREGTPVSKPRPGRRELALFPEAGHRGDIARSGSAVTAPLPPAGHRLGGPLRAIGFVLRI